MQDTALDSFKAFLSKGGKAIIMADALVKNGNFLIDTGLMYIGAPEFDCDYLAHPLGRQYKIYGSIFHKKYFMQALKLVYEGASLCVNGLGAQGRATAKI